MNQLIQDFHMTTIAFSQVPELPTVEQYVAWSSLLAHRLNPGLRVLETENVSEYAATASTFTAADDTERLLVRVNLGLNPNWQSSAAKIWTLVNELSNTTAPAAYLR